MQKPIMRFKTQIGIIRPQEMDAYKNKVAFTSHLISTNNIAIMRWYLDNRLYNITQRGNVY